MIITRTPYRVSFFGGGTDFPAYYERHGGSVISTTINRYSYITCRILPPFFDHSYRIRYFQTERVGSVNDIQHPSVRECLKYLKYPHPLEILHSGDIPAMSGVGSSSAFTVGMLLSLYGLMGKMATKRELAENAVTVEQQWIKENVGSQDQFATAFGGLNRIDFGPGANIRLTPLIMAPEKLNYLQGNLIFCFSGLARFSSDIQSAHVKNISEGAPELDETRSLVDEAHKLLAGGEKDIDDFGRLLDVAWRIKKKFSCKVTNDSLNELYELALNAGALGGKVCGAGGGGFMIFYAPPDRRPRVEAALKRALLVPIMFEHQGAQVIFYSHYSHEFTKGDLFNPLVP